MQEKTDHFGGAAAPAEGVWIVVPVYNAAATLPQCLESLLRQTYPHWTACLVDDASTDQSMEVMRQYAAQNPRFFCLACPQNSGPAAARNLGLAAAQGRYVAFLDSDDWWDDTFLEQMVGAAEQFQADLVQCAWTLEWPDGRCCPEENTYPDLRVFDRAAFSGPLTQMMRGISMNHVARKLVRRELLAGLTFPPDLATAEDLAVCFQLLMRARRLVFLPQPLYHYYRHGAGLTGSGLNFGQKWAANRKVSRIMQAGLCGTEFDTLRFHWMAWLRPYALVAPKAVRLLRDKWNQGAKRRER